MERLDIGHHKFIALLFGLIMFIGGVLLGVEILGAAGVEGLLVIVFALLFLVMTVIFLLFMKLVHLRDDVFRSNAGIQVKVKRK